MERDSKILSDKFNSKYDSFFGIEWNRNILFAMYAFGVLLNSKHLKFRNLRPYNPKDNELIGDWDLEEWIRVTWGADDYSSSEIYENEFEEALQSKLHLHYLIEQAIKYERPAWALFALIGMMQGSLNQSKFELNEKFSSEDFINGLNLIPSYFLKEHQVDLEFLFHFFDETGLVLEVNSGIDIKLSKSK